MALVNYGAEFEILKSNELAAYSALLKFSAMRIVTSCYGWQFIMYDEKGMSLISSLI